jgi:hypothetical protein
MYDEAGDTVCLTCGHRVVGDEFGAREPEAVA